MTLPEFFEAFAPAVGLVSGAVLLMLGTRAVARAYGYVHEQAPPLPAPPTGPCDCQSCVALRPRIAEIRDRLAAMQKLSTETVAAFSQKVHAVARCELKAGVLKVGIPFDGGLVGVSVVVVDAATFNTELSPVLTRLFGEWTPGPGVTST